MARQALNRAAIAQHSRHTPQTYRSLEAIGVMLATILFLIMQVGNSAAASLIDGTMGQQTHNAKKHAGAATPSSTQNSFRLAQYQRRGGHGGRDRGGRGRGGGGGVGVGIGIGAIIVQQGIEADRRRRRRARDYDSYERPQRRRVTCRGGAVRKGQCYCRRGQKRIRIGRNAFRCRSRIVDDRPSVTCRGGTVSRRGCVCRRGATRIKTGRRSYVCKTQVADPGPRITCRSGRVKAGKCVCRAGRQRIRTGRYSYSCNRRIADPRPTPPSITAPRKIPEKTTPRRPIKQTTLPRRPRPTPPPSSRPPALPTPIFPVILPSVGAGERVPDFVPEEVLITVPRTAPQTLESNIASTYGLTILDRKNFNLTDERVVRMRVQPTENVPAVVQRLQQDPRVLGAQPNYLYQGPAPKKAQKQNPLQYALAKVDAANAQSIANGRGVIVAVIDSGVDQTHPDLSRVVLKSFNAMEGQIAKPDSHGTAIAGIIGGRGLVRGVAPGANLLDVRAFKSSTADGPRLATTFVLSRAMEWAIEQKARILNLSFSGPRDPQLRKVIQSASKRRAIMVAAAGNEGADATPAYPAAYEEVIAVTATDPSDKLYEKANHGSYIALAAPGVNIFAPIPGRAHNMHTGTSFAAAHVSGILALMLQRDPTLSANEALEILTRGARDLGPPGRDEQFGAGEANAYRALRSMPRKAAERQ